MTVRVGNGCIGAGLTEKSAELFQAVALFPTDLKKVFAVGEVRSNTFIVALVGFEVLGLAALGIGVAVGQVTTVFQRRTSQGVLIEATQPGFGR